MARLELCQLSIKIVLLARRWFLRHYHNLARSVDFHPRDMHTRRSDGLDRPRDVLLSECGWRAGHLTIAKPRLPAVASPLTGCGLWVRFHADVDRAVGFFAHDH
jgi:hypothetical protein